MHQRVLRVFRARALPVRVGLWANATYQRPLQVRRKGRGRRRG